MASQSIHTLHEETLTPHQDSSPGGDSGYALWNILVTLAGLVLIAFTKSTLPICCGMLLAFLGLFYPFYKGPLVQVFRLISPPSPAISPAPDRPVPMFTHRTAKWRTHISNV